MPRTVIDIEDDEEIVPIPLDRATRCWLVQMAAETGAHPSMLAAALLHDIVNDDLRAHGLDRPAGTTLN